ncbi:hypothetical protein [Prosthecobacter dejongeii]|uniref:Uncharacterized protein n=1 Tax=Prosthecobacter dejongeii TaxID=48465 RepID=A0A7W7YIW9_9BACT|nr:hypothetical protein [Prosthecobacter dejongeii]MBB5036892.1 hypothetical protein [Prosthecobacter dejongeii]
MNKPSLAILCCLLAGPCLGQKALLFQADKPIILADKRIHESSGLTRSVRHPCVFWTLNDSGGEPCVFAIDEKGQTRAKVRLPKAVNFDWEDLASGTDEKGRPCLLIADIGDNLKVRASLQIYRIPEPDLPEDTSKEIQSAEPEIWHLAYPDGRQNAECLIVHPQTQQMWILTKEENGVSTLYEVTGKRRPDTALKLEKITTLTFPAKAREGKRPGMACMTTAATISPDGRRLLVATYSYLHEWKLTPGQPLIQALQSPASIIAPPLTRQMEGVCYGDDSSTIWFTSEQLPSPLYRLRRK